LFGKKRASVKEKALVGFTTPFPTPLLPAALPVPKVFELEKNAIRLTLI
jgi:hypothetical protein